jgi:hypothetical protein
MNASAAGPFSRMKWATKTGSAAARSASTTSVLCRPRVQLTQAGNGEPILGVLVGQGREGFQSLDRAQLLGRVAIPDAQAMDEAPEAGGACLPQCRTHKSISALLCGAQRRAVEMPIELGPDVALASLGWSCPRGTSFNLPWLASHNALDRGLRGHPRGWDQVVTTRRPAFRAVSGRKQGVSPALAPAFTSANGSSEEKGLTSEPYCGT